ncbi:hypothetical protein MHYP_G00002190 [Metynnis hypsauchen]
MQTFCRTVLNHIVPCLTGDPQAPGQQGQQLQDYTKAWEEYYKKQGGRCGGFSDQPCVADCSQFLMSAMDIAGQGAPQTAAVDASQPGRQPDYSAAWAEYYRQQAAYYGKSGSRSMRAAPQAQQLQQASRQQSDKTLTELFSSYTGLFISLLGMGVVGGVEFSLNEKLRVVSNKPEVEI